MAYQEVNRTSYGKNVGNSFRGILTGLLMVIIATVLIFWNENRAIKTYKAIGRAQEACVEMPDINTISPDFEGKTIHAIGVASTNEKLTDDIFGVSANALCIKRQVEYYQWVEHTKTTTKEKFGGATEETTTYTYSKEWVSSPQASADFKDPNYQNRNFIYQRIDEKEIVAENVNFGAYKLPSFIVKSINGNEAAEVMMDEDTRLQWNNAVKAQLGLSENLATNYVNVKDNVVYLGPNMNMPDVGDVRITFTYVPNDQQISIIANVTGNTFTQYVDAKNGKTISSVAKGAVPAEQMFETLKKNNKMLTWAIRLILLILIIAGFRMIFRVVPTLLKVLPFLGKGVGAILGFVCTIIGIAWTLVFTAIAWVSVRPVLAIAILVVAIALIVWLVMRSKKQKETLPADA
jgi:hypothetical protein